MLKLKENTKRKKGNFRYCPYCAKILSNLQNEISFPDKLCILQEKSHREKYNKFIHTHKHKFSSHLQMKNAIIKILNQENKGRKHKLSFTPKSMEFFEIDMHVVRKLSTFLM